MDTHQNIKKIIAARLRTARLAAGWRYASQFALRMGIYPSSYWHYERGNTAPRAERLAQIADMLSVSTDWLLGLSDDGGPDTN